MRILFLAHRLPYPPHKGEKIRALNVLRFLARHHEVYLGCLVDDPRDLEYAGQLRAEVRDLLFERIRPGVRQVAALSAMLALRPISVSYFYSRSLQRRIDALIERDGIEAVLCFSSPMADYVFRSRHRERLKRLPRVMDLVDVDSHKWAQYARTSALWRAWIYAYEARRLAAFERRIAGEFDRVLVVSEQELQCFPGGETSGKLLVVTNGVDLEFFRPDDEQTARGCAPALVFTGVMDYRPNVQGIRWFAERVFPRIRSEVPPVELYVVGNRPAPEVSRLASRPGVVVTGFVPDVRAYLTRASVCIAPLKMARGIQNKILEAMAMGRPVVSTPEAFEGLAAQPGRDLLVASSETEFGDAVMELLRNPQRAAEIGRNARACVREHYGWTANLEPLLSLFSS